MGGKFVVSTGKQKICLY